MTAKPATDPITQVVTITVTNVDEPPARRRADGGVGTDSDDPQ